MLLKVCLPIQPCLRPMALFTEQAQIILVKRVNALPDRNNMVDVQFSLPMPFQTDTARILITPQNRLPHPKPVMIQIKFCHAFLAAIEPARFGHYRITVPANLVSIPVALILKIRHPWKTHDRKQQQYV